jgi:hypothetical protein
MREGIFSTEFYSNSCFLHLYVVQKGFLAASSFRRRMVSSSGGDGWGRMFAVPGLFLRVFELYAAMVEWEMSEGQALIEFVFIRCNIV